MRILIDTNVILDVLMQRDGFESGREILRMSHLGKLQGFVSASAITDIFYILYRHIKDKKETIDSVRRLIAFVQVASVDEKIICEALESGWADFEDAVQYQAAKSRNARYIVTRNTKDFEASLPEAITPEDFLTWYRDPRRMI